MDAWNNIKAIMKRELGSYFSSPIAYAVMTVFLLIMGYSFTLTLFLSHQPSLVHIFFQMFVLFMLTAPLITMRLIAEERKLRTLEVLLTAPVSEIEIVLAKFVASMSLIALMLLLSASYAAVLAWFGDPDFGPIYSGYFGLLLFGAAVFFSVKAQTNMPLGPRWIAAFGTTTALTRVSTLILMLTNSPGQSRSSAFGKLAFRR